MDGEEIKTEPVKHNITMKLKDQLWRNLPLVESPSRYMGGEWNAVHKDHNAVSVSIALAFPEVYEVGMSNLGMKILYNLVNIQSDMLAERVFAPAPDMESVMRREELPLFSLESHTPLQEFDLIGFSLQHELTFTNILNMLDLARIPFRSVDRNDSPLVIGGGVGVFNAEPVADFFDLLVLGDGEEVLLEIMEMVKIGKSQNRARKEILLELARIEGVYVPGLYQVDYDDNGRFSHLAPLEEGVPAAVKKRVLDDLDKLSFPNSPVVPFREIVHDRAILEIARGCPRRCRFCQAGVVYSPLRFRSPEKIKELATSLLENTGYEEISLASLSSSDYPQFDKLVNELACIMPQDINISLPSLRLDAFSVKLAEQVQKEHKSSLTFAPEAGTARLRKVIRKDLTEEDIMETLKQVFQSGWRSVKLYFMIGLPTETDEDLMGIVKLAGDIVKMYRREGYQGRLKLGVSISTFIPKPHTPFQWEPMITLEEIGRRHSLLSKALRSIKQVKFKWHEWEMSFLEGVFSRGDRRLSAVLEEAWRRGCRMDNWSEHFKLEGWRASFEAVGLSPEEYANRRYEYSEKLPWSHMEPVVKAGFLELEHQKAVERCEN